jgi:NosR/NirI family transcriptional regulator, nitrous oxide reductase regulator
MTTPQIDPVQIGPDAPLGQDRIDPLPGQRQPSRRQALVLVILTVLSLVFAWLIGLYRSQEDLTAVLSQILPAAQRFDLLGREVYAGYAAQGGEQQRVGYVSVADAYGYGGPIRVAVGLDGQGRITQIAILQQSESMAFLRKIIDQGLPEALAGRPWSSEFRVGHDIDAVTGATASLDGLTSAVRVACQRAARWAGVEVSPPARERPVVGGPEVVLILLYAAGFVAYRRSDAVGRWLQSVTLVAGVLAIGLWLNGGMSLIHINAFLLGYWPAWQDHLYWYLLIGGVLLPILLTGKSLYCSHVCPFGATQQALAGLGLARPVSERWHGLLRSLQRILVWLAVAVALVFRNPALVPYDISGTLFGWTGLTWQFGVLAVVLVASLVITRPWCNYLCPVRAVTDFVRLARRALSTQK